MEESNKFKKKLDKITNGQIILFIKHCKINMVRITNDEGFDGKEDWIIERNV